jgi:DNA-binding winged helix-turn-helix (wHTH) protein
LLHSGLFYQFGSFQLEPGEHLLLRDGQPVSLTPKTFELLVFLVEHRGRLVTKDQILEAVWPGSFVEEANLTVSVSALRKALGEKRGEKQYIDTIPKKAATGLPQMSLQSRGQRHARPLRGCQEGTRWRR